MKKIPLSKLTKCMKTLINLLFTIIINFDLSVIIIRKEMWKMSINNIPFEGLTASEVSNLWSSYLMNSMEQRLLEYFFASTDHNEIKQVIEKILNKSKQNLAELREIFISENFTVPFGFTDEDVMADAHKVFSDTFILHFCFDLTMLSMSTYPSALGDCTRKDIRDHFQKNTEISIKFQNEIVDLMLTQGVYLRPPQVAIDSDVEFADTFFYLNGFFGGSRMINTAEVANLARVIHRAQFSKMVFVAFSKLAKTKELKQYFSKGRDEIQEVLDSLQEVLDKENIPISSSGDYKVFDVEMPPFSDKLMLFFVNTCLGIFCFAMISQAITSCLRTDIIFKLDKISDNMKKYYTKGLLLAIEEKWFEQPPQVADRKV
jgi:ferritin-like metal-binding protein YciE